MNKIANMHVASPTAGSLSRRSLFKLAGSLQPSLPELRWPGARLSSLQRPKPLQITPFKKQKKRRARLIS